MLSLNPTIQELFQTQLVEEPLVPIGAEPTAVENAALAAALLTYSKRSSPDCFSSLTGFLETYPNSPWNLALLINLGLEYYNTGHYSKTLDVWKQAWEFGRLATDLNGRAMADRAVGELAYMYARLGQMSELDALLRSLDGHVFGGPATEKICGAREGLWTMQNRPDIAFRCGPLALHRIKLSVDPANPGTALIHATVSTEKGFSLPQVEELSKELGLHFQMAFRKGDAAFAVPSVAHLKLDHYAAVIRQDGDRYLLQDPTFGSDMWVTRDALEAETTGYFLIPPGELASGWRAVEMLEGATVWGKGQTTNNDERPHGPCDPHTPGGNSCPKNDDCKGMAVPRVHLMLVSLNINDDPLGYAPPVGPAVRFMVRYNQREARQPAVFSYSNLGHKWTFDWLSYITEHPSNPSADVNYYIMGGGTRTFTGFVGDAPGGSSGTYAFQQLDQTKLTRKFDPTTLATSYEMLSRDGTKQIFSRFGQIFTQPGEPVTINTRRVFLTQLIDPHGNAVSLEYDLILRIRTITDAVGNITTISYENSADPFKLTKVTDPFGRFAKFEYDDAKRLIKITDVIGIISEFTYDLDGADGSKSDFIVKLKTPYGDTKFTKTESGNTRSLETLYPDGNSDRVEYNQSLGLIFRPGGSAQGSDLPQSVPGGMATRNDFLTFRNTFYWDKQAFAHGTGDHTKAKIYHWLHSLDLQSSEGILESTKEPLENRVWYDYAGQGLDSNFSIGVGSTNKPAHVGRVLDDGSTQLYTYEYNGFGNVTKTIDPLGRTFSYTYADNDIDLLEVRQTRDGQSELLSKTAYKTPHLPFSQTDAAGQTTTYIYNERGQITSKTNANNDRATYDYTDGFLTSINGHIPGMSLTLARDTIGRVVAQTEVDGYTLTFEYDNLDRVIKVVFPDSTVTQLTYLRLDRTLMQDRAGRKTSFEFNSVRQMTKRTDSLNRTTRFEWCKCGALRRLTDPMCRTTTWRHDVQGRIKSKEYPDDSKVSFLYENTTSRLRQRIDEKLQVTQYNYDLDNTVRQISYTNVAVATPPVTFSYDKNYSRVSSMTDGTGTTLYKYYPIGPFLINGAGKLASSEGPLRDTEIIYTYDILGRIVTRSINNNISSFIIDGLNRVATESNVFGNVLYAYDGATTRLSAISNPNPPGGVGQTTTFTYRDNLGDRRLERITHAHAGTLISEFSYAHNVPANQITSWSQKSGTLDPLVYSLSYDAVNQLTSAEATQSGSVVNSFVYTYDAAENRLSERVGGSTAEASYNALNQMTTTAGNADALGTYEWDGEHRLVAIKQGDIQTEFTYDGLGRRASIRQLVGDIEVSDKRYVWSGSEICEERTPDGALVKRFFPSGMKIESGPKAGAYFYTRDHLGSIRELTDAAGSIRARYRYDLFGRRTRLTGDLEADFGFAGMFWATEAGLNLTWFRTYDARIGRWLSRDPIQYPEMGQGSNLYTYGRNNPISLVDPLGLKVYRCCRNVDVNPFANFVSNFFGYQHCFILTWSKEAGMGPAGAGQLPAFPLGIDTTINDHSGESSTSHCEEINNIDEDCVDKLLNVGGSSGSWWPWNNCNTFVDELADKCWKKDLY